MRGLVLALVLVSCAPKSGALDGPVSIVGMPTADTPIPWDPGVTAGQLDNGLHWFVETNAQPKERAELRLVINAGSILEDDDQLGLAHFLEHMAFNGTTHFEGNALIDYMESVGMSFGAHVNAYTSFDETVYQLTVPTDDPALVDRGLLVLRDQAGGMLLDPYEIERERGVVLEEWRSGRGPNERIGDAVWTGFYVDSMYGRRLPIGTAESLETFSPEALARFYKDWYRPELMSVIVVGDVDTAAVVAQIETLFGDMVNPVKPRPRVVQQVPAHPLRVQVVSDPEATDTYALFTDSFDGVETGTYGGYREHLLGQMFGFLVDQRLGDLAEASESPVLGSGGSPDRLNAMEEEWGVYVASQEGRLLEAVEAVASEIRRIQVHGFTDKEVEDARAVLLQSYEEYHRERNKTHSATAAEELVRVVTSGESMPGIPEEHRLANAWVPTLSKAELRAHARDWMKRGSLTVQLITPDVEGIPIPEEAEVRAILAKVAKRRVRPIRDARDNTPLLETPPPVDGATVVSRDARPVLGATVLTLSNGVRVWLKPTDFKDDEVILEAQSAGGVSLADDAHYYSASAASSLHDASGLGRFDQHALYDRLTGVRAGVSTDVGADTEGVYGWAPPDELETMLQLVYLNFTESRFTDAGLDSYLKHMRDTLVGQQRAPERPFYDAWRDLVWTPSVRSTPWTQDVLDHVVLDDAEDFWRARFANAADFEWILVGSFDPAEIEPLLVQYLGALPTDEAREDAGPHRRVWREGRRDDVVYSGTEPKAEVRMMWHGPFEGSWEERNRLLALTHLLDVRLGRDLREDRGGVYGVSVGSDAGTWPEARTEFTVAFTCAPERVDELSAAVLDQVARVVTDGVTDAEVAVEQEKNRRAREEAVRSNGFWSSGIVGAVVRGERPEDLLTYDARNESLTPAAVHDMARRVFAPDGGFVEGGGFVKAVLLPESARPQ